MAPPLVGVGFQSNWNGLTAGDLSERIRVSMPLGAEGSLSRQQVSDIIAAIFAAGDYPAGRERAAERNRTSSRRFRSRHGNRAECKGQRA